MLIRKIAIASLLFALIGIVVAQAPKVDDKGKTPASENELDPVSKQSAAIEAQLAKTNSTSKEGAELMLKLIDLYYDNGRPFGLVRVAQSFVGLHSTHPRHKDVMLKLIDGLTTTGRNKELIATGRQFLARNPADPACAEIERWLARLVRKTNDIIGTAAVLESHWKRLGATAEGPRAGREAIGLYFSINNADTLAKAAALGEDMLDKLPAGGPATSVGWSAVDAQERLSQWAKANLVATKLLAKSPPTTPYYLQYLHARMAENYSRLGQRVNAIESWRKAIAVVGASPRPDLNSRMIEELAQTNPKPADIEPAVNDYVAKFPDPARPLRPADPSGRRLFGCQGSGQGRADLDRSPALRRPLAWGQLHLRAVVRRREGHDCPQRAAGQGRAGAARGDRQEHARQRRGASLFPRP